MKRRITLTAHGMATVVLNADVAGGITWEVDSAHDAIAFDDRTAKVIALGEQVLKDRKTGKPSRSMAQVMHRHETARLGFVATWDDDAVLLEALEADRAAAPAST